MKHKKTAYGITAVLLVYLFLPLIATFLYSVAVKWDTTVLPDGLTLDWYRQLYADPRFLTALKRSLVASGLTCTVSLVVMLPTVFVTTVYFPKLERVMKLLITIPFALPGIILSVGLIRLYSGGILPIAGTLWILLGAYFVVILPYMYQGIRNAIDTLNVTTLMESARLLGASDLQAFLSIILPNLIKGVSVSLLLSFSVLFGEFVLANFLVGGHYKTVQVYLFNMRGTSGHFTSAIVMSYFLFILFVTLAVRRIRRMTVGTGR